MSPASAGTVLCGDFSLFLLYFLSDRRGERRRALMGLRCFDSESDQNGQGDDRHSCCEGMDAKMAQTDEIVGELRRRCEEGGESIGRMNDEVVNCRCREVVADSGVVVFDQERSRERRRGDGQGGKRACCGHPSDGLIFSEFCPQSAEFFGEEVSDAAFEWEESDFGVGSLVEDPGG